MRSKGLKIKRGKAERRCEKEKSQKGKKKGDDKVRKKDINR